MESEVAYLERRIAEEAMRALMADCDTARAAHQGLLKLYRDQLGSGCSRALERYRREQVERAA